MKKNYSLSFKLLLILLFITLLNHESKAIAPDTSYIKPIKKELMIYGFLNTNVEKVRLFFPKSSPLSGEMVYSTNDDYNLGAGIAYKGLSISGSLKVPLFRHKDHGNTNGYEWIISSVRRDLILDILIINHKGMYLKNSDNPVYKIYPEVIIFPNLSTFTVGVNITSATNKKYFSFSAIYDYDELQTKSSGSFLYGGTLSYFNFSNYGNSIIPLPRHSPYSHNYDIYRIKNFNFGFKAGYTHSFVLRPFNFNLTLVPGISYQPTETYSYSSENKHVNHLYSFDATIRSSIMYSNSNFFCGINILAFMNIFKGGIKGNGYINHEIRVLSFIFGHRFNYNYLNEKYDQIKKQYSIL